MNITILNVAIATKPTKTGKTYQEADVAFKNNTFQGKVEGKKVLSFGAQAEAFKVLATAQPGDTFEVEVVKNDKGYNDWVSMQKAGITAGGAVQVGGPTSGTTGVQRGSAATPVRSTYETPEERAQRQVYIIRQSSISSAIAALSVGAKKLESNDVIALAKKFEGYVFDRKDAGASGFDDIPDFPADVFADSAKVD